MREPWLQCREEFDIYMEIFEFVVEVRRQCDKENYVSVINDENMDLDELVNQAAAHFGFKFLDT